MRGQLLLLFLTSALDARLIGKPGSLEGSRTVTVRLRRHEQVPHTSLLALGRGVLSRSSIAHHRFRHNHTHAIEYVGDIQVGGQTFTVIFDTGSDRLIVPAALCPSPACLVHRRYSSNDSAIVSGDFENVTPQEVSFGSGKVVGLDGTDAVCLGDHGSVCAEMDFVQALSESDDPFRHAHFDGVMGLALPALRKNATKKTSVLQALVSAGAIPEARFAVFMSKNMREDSEITFGDANPAHAASPFTWVQLSEPGYWQFTLHGISVGGQQLQLCQHAPTNGTNVSSFFGKMCCRTVSEFEHEERCQYAMNSTQRSRYTDHGVILATYEDGRVAVRMRDGCVQKVPVDWLSLPDGCRGDGTIQAILDTGSSLMMAPSPLATTVLAALGVRENCTGQSGFQNLSFMLPGGQELVMAPTDYMDVLSLPDGDYCWPHLMPMPETAKGAVLVLGMPFLRTFYTAFDAELQRVGFAVARQLPSKKPYKMPTAGANGSLQRVSLRGFRPAET